VEGKQYDSIINLTFSPDGEHLVYIANNLKDKSNPLSRRTYIVIDGEEREYSTLLATQKQVKVRIPAGYSWYYEMFIFNAPDILSYVAAKGTEVYQVEVKLK